MWLNDNPDSFLEGGSAVDFSSVVSLSTDPLQLFWFDFPLSGFSLVVELVFRLFDNSPLCGATGDGGGVGSILRLLGSPGGESKGLVAGGEPRVVSPGTDGSLRLAFGLLPGEPGGLRELIPEEYTFKDSSLEIMCLVGEAAGTIETSGSSKIKFTDVIGVKVLDFGLAI